MKRRVRRTGVGRRGFTLLEVLMVIVILGVLAALIVPQFTGVGDRAKVDLTRQLVTSGLATQLEVFKTHCGRYPTTEEGLAVLIQRPDDEEISEKWSGPYVKTKELKDAWGRDLRYRSPGEINEDSYDLYSVGKDGNEGTDDDITNWEKR